ncbi:bifunctional aspartate kinase/homoserine dehydrogenase I [Buchnera aphidicola]|uniref:bifunctional aspartate kinase/homoserine dehydrogenase I n=1 Tax=Buchnera aphidicola TaxID=9 RepID=UPI0034640BB1
MQTLKFGGTSLSNAKKFLHVSEIIKNKTKDTSVSVVLSAPAKVTNYLSEIIENIQCNQSSENIFISLKKIFNNIIYEIQNFQIHFPYQKILNKVNNILQKIQEIIQDIQNTQEDINYIYAKIISIGERISIIIMKELLILKNFSIFVIDPIKTIIATGNPLHATVELQETQNNFKKNIPLKKTIILMAGFIAGNQKNQLVTLGRNGSDYSAAILAVCLNAHTCEIWTDVDGVYTTDPKISKKAKLLKSLSYEEAIELSYFGAKVLHPKTILPLFKNNIKCVIKNTSAPNNEGTIIEKQQKNHLKNKIKGITYLDKIIMVQIKILKTYESHVITKKIFLIFFESKIQILLTQYSHLQNIYTFYIIGEKYQKIQELLYHTLKNKIDNKIIEIIKIEKNIKVISVIGNNIKNDNKIIKKIMYAIQYSNMNNFNIINHISQNSISIITNTKNIIKKIKIIHDRLFNKKNILEIFLIGIGGVGSALIQQFSKQKFWLKNKNIKFKICGIANSKNMFINLHGIRLDDWRKNFYQNQKPFCIKTIIQYAKKKYLYNPVIIDCTASQKISDSYDKILSNKIHIVTPNKKANTNHWNEYKKIRKIAIKVNKKFLYETNVSAGLPVITTLRNLFYAGDKLISFQGILSGSLSYIFGKLEEGVSITESTKMAQKLGFTEPNPKDDLSGIDVARKLLIIAREAGYPLELKDIDIQPILPKEFFDINDEKIFFKELQKINKIFLEKSKKAKKNKKVLRYIGNIQSGGICQVKLIEVDKTNPLYNVKNGENALTIYSNYYQPIPLVLRGYGAGNNVTAAGIFSDLLQILS